MTIKLNKVKAEDIENGEYAEYVVVGAEHITIGKYRERYHYNGRDGWGHYGTRDWWQAIFRKGEDRRRVDGPTRNSVMAEVAERLESGQWS